MSTTRARLLIAGVWVSSFVICLPPLVGWRDKRVCKTCLLYPCSSHIVSGKGDLRIDLLDHRRCLIVSSDFVIVTSHVQHDVSPVQPVQHHHYTRPDKAVPMDLRIDQRHRLRHLQVVVSMGENKD